MSETVRERLGRQEHEGVQMKAFLRNGPYEPLATRAEVLEVTCPTCQATSSQPCKAFPFTLLWLVFRELGGIHTHRYLAKTHDPR